MNIKKLGLAAFCVSLAVVPCLAAEERISALLRSMLDRGEVPAENVFYDAINEDYVRGLSADSVKEFLPLARTLLRDSRAEARRLGLMCFFVVTLRFSDGEPLLEPYVPDLLRIVDDRTSPLRPMAMEVVGNTWPKRSPKTIAYLTAHLPDKDNTAEDTSWMACMLLESGTDILTHEVIAFVRKQDKLEVIKEVLRCIRVMPIRKTADVLALIGFGLDSADVWVRRRAVEAVGDMPLVERSPFLEKLNRLATDANEPIEIRSAAAEALKK
jgi:hypothetical protein